MRSLWPTRSEFLWDDELRGFGVHITLAGVNSYVLQYKIGGRSAQKKAGYNRASRVTLDTETSREEASRLALLVGQGVDPVEAAARRKGEAVDLAFTTYVKLFVDRNIKTAWKDWNANRRLLVSHAVPVLGSTPIPSISQLNITAVLDRVSHRPAIEKLFYAILRNITKIV